MGSNIANFNGYIQINETAACLWEYLKEPVTTDQLEKILEETYGISHEKAVEDVLNFLMELKDHDMVVTQ